MDEQEPAGTRPARATQSRKLLKELEKSTSELSRQTARTAEFVRITDGPLNRTMQVYINKLSEEELKEFRAAVAIITRLASDIREEETRVVRKLEHDE